MHMTEKEIVTSFRQAKNRERQVAILAQLNACTTGDIVEVLLKNGFTPKDIPGRYRKGGKRDRKAYRKEHQVPPPKRDTNTGKMVCAECGTLFDGKCNAVFCAACGQRRREKWEKERRQRDKERLAAERAASGPKLCADCGTPLKSKLNTYCAACAARRKRESQRKSKKRKKG